MSVREAVMRTTFVLVAAALLSCERTPPRELTKPVEEDTEWAMKNLRAQAQILAEAVRAEDHGKVADLTHPGLVKHSGGKEKYVALLEKMASDIRRQGFKYASVTCAEPSKLVKGGEKLYAVVTTKSVMNGDDGSRLIVSGYLIALSADNGATWKFLSGTKATRDEVKQLLPLFPDELEIPAIGPPVVERPDK